MRVQPSPIRFPNGIDHEGFLRDYWQKRPLLMRAAISPDSFPLAPDELAGLACETEFESRLIIERSPADWQVKHGPFDDNTFAALPESHWTLLVQDVDKFVPEVTELIDLFDFVPSWRIDDIMISYATDQGGVGPHTDAYDVFLMQAQGKRRWRLSNKAYSESDLIPGLEQRILSSFDTDEEWVLEPGDVLYLPPGMAHWGIAEGECMTYSLGFRAPSQQELAVDWFQHLVDRSSRERLFGPSDLDPHALSRITPGAVDAVANLLAALPQNDSAAFALWLGDHLTEPKEQFSIEPPEQPWTLADLRASLNDGSGLIRHPCARLAWQALPTDEIAMFFQGEHKTLSTTEQPLVASICAHRHLDAAMVQAWIDTSPLYATTVLDLINRGILEPDDSDE